MSKNNIIFITGTDTGVGKTLITSLLLQQLLADGLNVTAVKPIETGCKKSKGELIPADGKVYQKLLHEKIELIVPYRYQLAVAPIVAAKKEKRTISIEKIKKLILEKAKNHSLVLVEGAGGLLVPITEDYSFADLAKDLQAKCLVVVGSRLGAINQALLTFEVLKNRKIK
ncbi:MAG: dethiobiotin synthase, partial [Proteobacteria bacterium]|nr:dethiobiotin synthase [Pseudomonadota bacterium]